LVFILFIGLCLLVMELGRLMFIYTAAAEATRLGARLAAVCGPTDSPAVQSRMAQRLGLVTAANTTFSYPPESCDATLCDPVRVRLSGVVISLNLPFAPINHSMASFSTAIPAESLDSTNNPLCQ
jgi:hypothetical protein